MVYILLNFASRQSDFCFGKYLKKIQRNIFDIVVRLFSLIKRKGVNPISYGENFKNREQEDDLKTLIMTFNSRINMRHINCAVYTNNKSL